MKWNVYCFCCLFCLGSLSAIFNSCSKTPDSVSTELSELELQELQIQKSPLKYYIPDSAINIRIIDKYWCYFELDDKLFLLGLGGNGNGRMAITQIQDH